MHSQKIFKIFSLFIFLVICVTTFIYPSKNTKASNIKTITITFATTPTFSTVSKAPLKYNKDFAWSYSFDDGIIRGYDTAFKYMNGGYSDYIGQYFGGLYFTDGAGNNVPFRGGYAFYSRNSTYSDIHVNTPSYTSWTQLQDTVDNGWNVFNHGYTSASIDPKDPNYVFYTNDPGGHATGVLDYAYELTQNNVDVASHISLKNNNGTVTGPLNISHVILPNGDDNYIQPAFNNGFKGVYAQSPVFPFDSTTVTAPDFTNVTNFISSNRHVMPRWFDYDTRYMSGGSNPGELLNHVDELATMSTGPNKYWAQEFTHQITTSTYLPDANGGMTWNTWKSLMDHVENTYGRFGNDKAWVAGAEEVYNYMMVKQNTTLVQNLVGNQLTVDIDVTNVPANLTTYALSLLVTADATISSIDYGSSFTYHTDNKTTGLINLDWGVNSYSKNDITRVDTLVTTAESSKRKSDVDMAKNYVNLLPSGTTKTNYTNRLNAIVIPLRTWYVKVRGGITSAINCYSTSTTTYTPSVYNWNTFYVGKNSLICSDLTNLKDSDNQSSSMSLSNTAAFDGGLQSNPTGNNSGIYPDAVLDSSPNIYKGAATPAKIKIYGLENTKTYNIKLFGYTSAGVNNNTKDNTSYTIGSITKNLMVAGNISNTVEFTDILPTSGEIEVSIVPQNPAWGYGMLNAMEIKENILAAPSSLSYTTPNTYIKNDVIASLPPSITGQGVTYSVSPSLPVGLSLNISTGVISGTPTVTTSLSNYVVTATNTGGSISFGIIMTVNDIAPSSLSYSTPKIFTRNSSIIPLSSTVTGESIIYSVSPALPSGLSLDTSTGVISGTPTAITSLATYTVTATNTGGNTTFDIVITVNDIAPSTLSYTSPNTFTKNSAITQLSPTVTGSVTSYSLSTILPAGLSLDTSTGVISGTPTAVTDIGTYTIIATNSGGSITFGVVITVRDVVVEEIPGTYMKYSTTSMPANCSNGSLYLDTISFAGSTRIYIRVCKNSDNSSVSTFEFVTPVNNNTNSGGGGWGSSGGYYIPPANNSSSVSKSSSTILSYATTTPIETSKIEVSLIQKIKKDLEIGMRNKDVKTLQQFLIDQNKGPIAKKLSVNGTSTYFGKLTKDALIEWQKDNKIYPASGNFGSKTRTKIKALGL